ncbi:hypothetical protein BDV59DRAFT_170801 [Aspergillus ambiguus]|uniref:uncharacterized protein n=1 Tax=Aspergillus ambiguus TaxID=176160 RepID=UPI003CCD2D89
MASVIKTRPRNGPSWVHETPYLPPGWEECSPQGASSLRHIAMRRVLSDQRVLTASLFETVPWRIASYLWDCLGQSGKRTLYMWKVFATVYPDEFPACEKRWTMTIEGPLLSMPQYLSMVRSDALRWWTVLTLAASFARVPDMVGVAEVRNLVALEVATPTTPPKAPVPASVAMPEEAEMDTPMTAVSDRIVRAWAELAQTEGAFAHLRVMRFTNQTEITSAALRYLKDFPALRTVIVCGCPGVSRRAETVDGWALAEMAKPQAALYSCYEKTVSSSEVQDRPVLEFQVGQKRKTNAIESLVFQRVAGEGAEPARKKLKDGSEGRRGRGRREKKKGVMRNRARQDLGGLLGEFLG